MFRVKPVMSRNEVLVVENVSVFVVDTTCNTLPAGKSARVIAGDTGPHTVVYNSNESVSSKYVTIPSDGEPKAAVLAAASANTMTA